MAGLEERFLLSSAWNVVRVLVAISGAQGVRLVQTPNVI
jgi:hypothetical protein